MANMEPFVTTQKQNYKWPYPKPMVPKPTQPPLRTKPNNFYVAKLVEPYCHCDAHLYDPQMNRYKKLADKETILNNELAQLHEDMSALASEILDHPCDASDEKMETIYQTDYVKRGINITKYRTLMPAIDSPVGVPVKDPTIGINVGYRDPTMFRYSAFVRPNIGPCPPLTFERTPTLMDRWFTPRIGKSEYQDTISKSGLRIIKNRQQYAEPLPSSRRRQNDPCL